MHIWTAGGGWGSEEGVLLGASSHLQLLAEVEELAGEHVFLAGQLLPLAPLSLDFGLSLVLLHVEP